MYTRNTLHVYQEYTTYIPRIHVHKEYTTYIPGIHYMYTVIQYMYTRNTLHVYQEYMYTRNSLYLYNKKTINISYSERTFILLPHQPHLIAQIPQGAGYNSLTHTFVFLSVI